jgi:hypothetical protein
MIIGDRIQAIRAAKRLSRVLFRQTVVAHVEKEHWWQIG